MKTKSTVAVLLIFSLFFIVFSLLLGRYRIGFADFFQVMSELYSKSALTKPQILTVLLHIRLPRVLAAFLIGAALSLSGAAGQGLFQNKLVSPDILGASAGAAFGSCLGILFGLGAAQTQVFAFFCGVLAVLLTAFVASRAGGGVQVLVLSGIMVSSIGTSLTALLKTFADGKDTLPAITFWLLGSLSSVTLKQIFSVILPFFFASIPLFWLKWHLNVLSLGTDEAKSLGLPIAFLRTVFIAAITLLTAAAVSISGIIGWVGLLIPHAARLLCGEDYRSVLPVSALLGGCYLLLIDNFSRTLFAAEIPLGVLTALVGAPFFLILIIKRYKEVEK